MEDLNSLVFEKKLLLPQTVRETLNVYSSSNIFCLLIQERSLLIMREIHRFGSIREVIELPSLTKIQINSYNTFLQIGVPVSARESSGLQSAFKEVFPIDETEKGRQTGLVLDFLEYNLQDPEFSPEECREKDLTFQAGLFAKLQLIHKDSGLIKEDQVFVGDLPLMTPDGSFVVNGADRVIVSQIHSSPGVYFIGGPKGAEEP